MLSRYAGFYAKTYGSEESVAELCPYMLQAFMDADRGFAKALKTLKDDERPAPGSRAKLAPNTASSS
jgi:hypothetical protein